MEASSSLSYPTAPLLCEKYGLPDDIEAAVMTGELVGEVGLHWDMFSSGTDETLVPA